ncbi:hypothetical protein F8M41_016565 [Gigaspora margarita]|uniref:Uncharacterized protein n=1 Tax=Gigaspora margarita TaxID=4874 RepID=A0A8H3WWW9_GIGMA|nr:hypothetical protein F8M41_016565 [Gigaspora margarita]
MQCIATLSKEDKSIVIWTITEELIFKYANSLNANNLEHALNTENIVKSDFKFESIFLSSLFEDLNNALTGISDCKQVIIELNYSYFEFDFAIIDITTKSSQILSAHGLELERREKLAFLENSDLAVVKS